MGRGVAIITKERLKEYTWIKENIKNLEDRLLEIDTRLTKSTSSINDDVVTTTKDNDKFTNLIHDRILIENEMKVEICKGYREMQFIEDTIRKLPEREKLLMRLRYINGHKWETICVKMNYEWRQIHTIHSNILKELKKAKTTH